MTDGFFTFLNLRNILDQQSRVLIATCFMTMAIISGNFDVSTASVFATAPRVALVTENATGSVSFAILAALLTGIAMRGAWPATARTRIFELTSATWLAFAIVIVAIAANISDRFVRKPATHPP